MSAMRSRSTPGKAIVSPPRIPFRRDDDAPPFAEPWQAQAFALTLALYEKGLFSWSEWAETLGETIRIAGAGDDGSRYYDHWLAATETLVTRKSLASHALLRERKDAWERAAEATPHGLEIRLANDPLRRSVPSPLAGEGG